MEYDLSRFAIAHQRDYQQALAEIKKWKKALPLDVVYFPSVKRIGAKLNF